MKRWTIVLVVLMTTTTAAQYKTSVARWQCAANSIAPTSLDFLWHGGAQDVRVSDPGCSWFAGVTASGQGWITLEDGEHQTVSGQTESMTQTVVWVRRGEGEAVSQFTVLRQDHTVPPTGSNYDLEVIIEGDRCPA